MRNIICIGASTGGLDAIIQIVRALPADLPAAVFVVRHIAPTGEGRLPEILQPYSALPVAEAKDGDLIQNGRITIAPTNHHLLLNRKTVILSSGPRENWARPAIDPLFRTAAQFHGPQAIGIILSGKLDDGTAGLWALKRRGGFAVVQQPGDASAPDMPRNALAAVDVDVVADAEEIGALLPKWCQGSSSFSVSDTISWTIDLENSYLQHHMPSQESLDSIATHPGIVCPDCGGKLWQMKEGPLRFRCHVGHGMSAQTLLAQQRAEVEKAGWRFVRTIEEEIFFSEELLKRARSPDAQQAGAARLAEVRRTAETARRLVERRAQDTGLPAPKVADGELIEPFSPGGDARQASSSENRRLENAGDSSSPPHG